MAQSNTLTKHTAESATGCVESSSGIGTFFNDKGNKITVGQARVIFNQFGTVEVPNAGAGSYAEVFDKLGYVEVESYDQGSSAGDWVFGISDGRTWRCAFQTNRYPYHGFAYKLGGSGSLFSSKDELFEYLNSRG